MTQDKADNTGDSLEHMFESILLAYDEALAAGTDPAPLETPLVPAELLPQVLSARNCLAQLERARCHREQLFHSLPPFDSDVSDTLFSQSPLEGRVGRFEIGRELGRGGHGVVFLARDPALNRYVALKVPRPEVLLTPDLSRRFLREAQAAGSLDHPNLVAVYEVGEDGPLHYIASAYCEGPTLAEWLRREAAIPLRDAMRTVAALADGVSEAHQHGILHRDIKPSNVLLEPRDVFAAPPGDELGFTPKLTDFGLAKLAEFERDATRSGVLLGTPSYMAPEQAAGRVHDIGPATDVYALGAVLYELLTGRRAFQGASDVDTLRHVVDSEPIAPRQLRREVSGDLQAVCLKCLESNPSNRYGSAAALAADLRRCLSGEPTLARPLGSVQWLVRWARRRPAAAGLAGLSVASTLLLIGLLLWHSATLTAALDVSRQQRDIADGMRAKADANGRLAVVQEEIANQHLYAIRMRLAHAALDQGDTPDAARLLAMYEPPSRWSQLRGFEWHFLQRLLHSEKFLLRTQGATFAVAFSPDGGVLATGGEDGTITLWNPSTGQQMEQFVAHASCVNKIAYSQDGRLLASGGCDNTVRLWSVAPRQELATLLTHDQFINSVSFSANGQWLAAVANDGLVAVWETASHKLVHQVKLPGPGQWVAWSPDDTLLAAGTLAVTQTWNSANWQERSLLNLKTMAGTFCRDSRGLLLVDTAAATLELWEPTNKGRRTVLLQNVLNPGILATSPNGRWLALGNFRELVELCEAESAIAGSHANRDHAGDADTSLDLENVRPKVLRTFAGHTAPVRDVAFSPDERLLASASSDGTVRLWDTAQTGGSIPVMHLDLSFSGSAPAQVAMNGDLTRLMIADDDRPFAVWDVSDLRHPLPLEPPPVGTVEPHRVAHGPTEQSTIWAGMDSGQIVLWDGSSQSGRTVAELGMPITRFICSADGSTVATLAGDRVVRVHDVQSGRQRLEFTATISKDPSEATLQLISLKLSLSPMGQELWMGVPPLPGMQIYDVSSGSSKMRTDTRLPEFRALDFSADGRLIAGPLQATELAIADTATSEIVSRMRLPAESKASAFSPDARTLATINQLGRVQLWNVATGQELLSLDVIPGDALFIKFSADGRRLAAIVKATGEATADLYVWSTDSML